MNSQEFAISIIIPTYKPQGYVLECFESIGGQSFDKANFEVIIVLNGDRDPYYSFLEKYLLCCNFNYRLFHTDVKGVSNARNIGIDQSNGRYLTFVDDDDIISTNYLQELYEIANNNIMPLSNSKAFENKIAVTMNYRVAKFYNKMADKKLTHFNTRLYFSFPFCKLIAREIIGQQRFDPRFQNGEDALFMFAISKNVNKMQFANEDVVYYRRVRNNSLMTRKVSVIYIIKNCFGLILATTNIYVKTPVEYGFFFYFFRILAILRTTFFMMKRVFSTSGKS